jgi:hypothetical protein
MAWRWPTAPRRSHAGRIAVELRVKKQTVGKWRGSWPADSRGCSMSRGRARRARSPMPRWSVVALTLESKPVDATHWSTRSMAKRVGMSQTAISRIWRAFALQPHRVETFKLSQDPLFVEKVRDIVGLYLAPPDKALVLCVDEKSQIQALDRTQPLLPLRPGPAPNAGRTTTRGTAPPRCLPRWMPGRAR